MLQLPNNNAPPVVRPSASINAGKTQKPHLFAEMPIELQAMIVCSFCPKRRDHRRTLCALACVNRAFNALAVPQLYSRVSPRAFSALLQRPKLAALVKEIYDPPTGSYLESVRADLVANGLLPEDSALNPDVEEQLDAAQSSEGESDEEYPMMNFKAERALQLTLQLVQCLSSLTSLRMLEFPMNGANTAFFSACPNPITADARTLQPPAAGLRGLTHLDIQGSRTNSVLLSPATICGLFFLPSLTHLLLDKVIGPGLEPRGGDEWTPIRAARMENAYRTSAVTHLQLDECRMKPWMLTSLLRLPRALRSLHYVHEGLQLAMDESDYLDLGELERALAHHRITLEHLVVSDVAYDDAVLRGRLTQLYNFPALTHLATETNYMLSPEAPNVSLVSLLPAALKEFEIGINGCPNVNYAQGSMKMQLLDVIRKFKLKKLLLMGEGLDEICDEVKQVCEEMGTECSMEAWDWAG